MRNLSVVLAVSAFALLGCGGGGDTGSTAGAGPGIDAAQAARLKSDVVSGKLAPEGCESRDITRFLSSPHDIESQDKTNEEAAKIGAGGHEVVTDDTGQIGVDTYKVSAKCKRAIEQTLGEATGP